MWNSASTALYVLHRVWIACSERAVLEHWIYAKVSLVQSSAEASLVATLSQSLFLSSSGNGKKLINSHIGMKKARLDNYQCCHDSITISVLSRS